MRFTDVIGQREVIERLKSLVDKERLPHAIMLAGPEGAGKMAIAISLASYILCYNRTETASQQAGGTSENGSATPPEDSCGECRSCKMLSHFQHPDLTFAFPIIRPKSATSDKTFDSDDYMHEWVNILTHKGPYFSLPEWLEAIGVENQQANLPVAESDRLTKALSMKSHQGGKKVCIIWLPEKMNISCANKMLKLIEEPPTDTHFIMVSVHPEQLLETIISRVQRFDVPKIALADTVAALQDDQGLSENDATRIARVANGNWLKALELLQPGNEQAWFFDMYVMLMRTTYARKVADLKKWSEQCAKLGREKQIRMLQAFQRLTREYFIYNFHEQQLNFMTEDEEQFAKKFAPFIHERNIILIYELFQRTIRDLSQNANPKIQFFDLTMKLAVYIHRT